VKGRLSADTNPGVTTATKQAIDLPPPISQERAAPSHVVSRQAFEAACSEHLAQVWRQLRTMGVAPSYLDDATQEVFLTAHRKWDSFEGRSQVSTWLYAIAYRVGCNYRRAARREFSELPEELPSRYGNPEQSLAERRSAQFVERFCAGLSEKLRDVFVLCLLEGQPANEVAALLGVPGNTVYSRLRLVREAFRQELARLEAPAKLVEPSP
jgi:RNA polymerase sigma-70 factor (ECF subfamily)